MVRFASHNATTFGFYLPGIDANVLAGLPGVFVSEPVSGFADQTYVTINVRDGDATPYLPERLCTIESELMALDCMLRAGNHRLAGHTARSIAQLVVGMIRLGYVKSN